MAGFLDEGVKSISTGGIVQVTIYGCNEENSETIEFKVLGPGILSQQST